MNKIPISKLKSNLSNVKVGDRVFILSHLQGWGRVTYVSKTFIKFTFLKANYSCSIDGKIFEIDKNPAVFTKEPMVIIE